MMNINEEIETLVDENTMENVGDVNGVAGAIPITMADAKLKAEKRAKALHKILKDAGKLPTDKPFTGREQPDDHVVETSDLDKMELSEDLDTEVATEPAVGVIVDGEPVEVIEQEPAQEGPRPGVDSGIANLLIASINKAWEAVADYNNMIATLHDYGREDLVDNINEINQDQLVHIGQLQKMLQSLSPNLSAIADGQEM